MTGTNPVAQPYTSRSTDQWGKISVSFTSIANKGSAKVDAIEVSPVASTQATPVSLGSAYNAVGLTNDGSTSAGNLNNYSYSATLLGPSLTLNGATYTFGTPSSNDVVEVMGRRSRSRRGNMAA